MKRFSRLVLFVAALCFTNIVMAKAINFTAVSAGMLFSCGLTDVGGVMCWGDNRFGQLGDGTTTNSVIPVNVEFFSSGSTVMTAIAVGVTHACALNEAGGVQCWGDNYYGQLGNSRTNNFGSIADYVTGLKSGVKAIAAAGSYTCALMNVGSVKCWGINEYGQLGNGATTDSAIPVDVTGLGGGVTAIAAGFYHSCALMSAGGVKCWGGNFNGQLGDGDVSTYSTIPVDVTGLSGGGMKVIAAGGNHTCVLMNSGGMKCWGYNFGGELGDSTIVDSSTPVDVTGLSGGVAAISLGSYHSCALMNAGGVECWGYNFNGQLGDGTTKDSSTPVDVVGLDSKAMVIAAGGIATCALTNIGGVKCWGDNSYGQLGDGMATYSPTPVKVTGLIGITAITAGRFHNCAVMDTGGVKCWGDNSYGQLGDGTTTDSSIAVNVTNLDGGVVGVVAGDGHSCALMNAGSVKCWGNNVYGQLGNGTFTDSTTPVNVTGLGSGVKAIAAGGNRTCAITSAGNVQCWSANFYGELGSGTTDSSNIPVNVTGLGGAAMAIAVGDLHSCAVMDTGGVRCWGINDYGQLGDGTTTSAFTPVNVTGLDSGVTAVVAGQFHTCALTNGGGVKCWGDNVYGELGYGPGDSTIPVDVTGLDSGVMTIVAGHDHNCALTNTHNMLCWGSNFYGSLGDGVLEDASSPVDVIGLIGGVVAIAAGSRHSCALMSSGKVYCWGDNSIEQLGNGKTSYSTTPVAVRGLGSSTPDDFDGDGKSDVLFMNASTRGVKYWKDADRKQLNYTGTYPAGYVYLGTGDFDGDGKSDILFKNPANNNSTVIWRGGLRSAVMFPGTMTTGFDDVAIGDFDGDGRDDIFWSNPVTGATSIWWAAVKSSATYPGVHSTAYTMAAAGDFDGDGNADVFWHNNTTGANVIWLGGNKSTVVYPGASSDLAWAPFGAGDVDGDGKADLIWYKASNGNTMVWNGGLKSATTYPGKNAMSFTPKAIGDYDGDGKADLLWSNDTTQATQIWLDTAKTIVLNPGVLPAGFALQK